MDKSGIITQNETWSGEIRVTGDVVIPAGVSVTVLPGSSVTFAPESDFAWEGREALLAAIADEPVSVYKADCAGRCFVIVEGDLRAAGGSQGAIVIGNDGWGGGIMVVSDGTAELSFCRITGAAFGIAFRGSAPAGISGNEFLNCVYGVRCAGTAVLRGNTFQDNTCGIGMCGGEVTAEGNTVIRSAGAGILQGGGSLAAARNALYGNKVGICQRESLRSSIEGNVISRNRTGIYTENASECDIVHNSMTDNEDAAIFSAGKAESVRIRDNNIGDSPLGIDCYGSGELEITGNTVDNVAGGMRFSGHIRGVLIRNVISTVKDTALFAGDFATVVLDRNSLSGALVGLRAAGNAQVQAEGNMIQARATGVLFSEQSRGTITGNVIEEAEGGWVTGAEIGGMASVEITGNRITGVLRGLQVNGNAQVKAEGNRIRAREAGISFR